MPENTKLDDARNSNNYLRDLTINGTTIEGFNYLKEEYVINVLRKSVKNTRFPGRNRSLKSSPYAATQPTISRESKA